MSVQLDMPSSSTARGSPKPNPPVGPRSSHGAGTRRIHLDRPALRGAQAEATAPIVR
jgi:hypothetical protein